MPDSITAEWKSGDIAKMRQNLDGLGQDVRDKISTTSMFTAAKLVLDKAISNGLKYADTGLTVESLSRRKVTTEDGFFGVEIYARRGKAYKGHGNLAHLIERGHRIVTRGGKIHGMYPARPFMRPALETESEAAIKKMSDLVSRKVNTYKAKNP